MLTRIGHAFQFLLRRRRWEGELDELITIEPHGDEFGHRAMVLAAAGDRDIRAAQRPVGESRLAHGRPVTARQLHRASAT
jgi:hypothetical protein